MCILLQPIGFTLGGGKGHIHHYVTPVSATRMIIEMGGHAEYSEVKFLSGFTFITVERKQ